MLSGRELTESPLSAYKKRIADRRVPDPESRLQ